jgi:hypothetical protein
MDARKRARGWALAAMALSGCGVAAPCSPGTPPSGPSAAPSATADAQPPLSAWPPSTRDTLNALLRHPTLPLEDASCRNVTGDPGDPATLGVYLAHLLAQGIDANAEEQRSSIQVSCEVVNASRARCRLDVRVEDEDPWEYGVTFEVDRHGAIPRGSLTCPGAG